MVEKRNKKIHDDERRHKIIKEQQREFIYEKAVKILEVFFAAEQDDIQNVAPNAVGNQFTFSNPSTTGNQFTF